MRPVLALCVFLAGVIAAPVAEKAASCPPLELVFLDGTFENGLGLVGTPLATALAQDVPGAVTYNIAYNTAPEYTATVLLAAQQTKMYIESLVMSCGTKTKIAIGGYSKGALVVHKTSLSSKALKQVIGIVVFGDPAKTSNVGGGYGLAKDEPGSDPYNWPINKPVVAYGNQGADSASPSTSNVLSFCNNQDLFCAAPNDDVDAHLAYGTDGSAPAAASFLAGRYKQ